MQESTNFDLPIVLPKEFTGATVPWGWFAFRPAEREKLTELGFFSPDKIETLGGETEHTGRAALRRLSLSSGSALLRRYRHGGLGRALRGKNYSDPVLPFQELKLAQQLLKSGLNTPAPVAAVAVRQGSGYRLFFLSHEIFGEDLHRFLLKEKDSQKRAALFQKTGSFLRRLHDWGLWHADLHFKNLFLEKDTGEVFILDLDRSEKRDKLSEEDRIANLTRLYRYGKKQEFLRKETLFSEEEFQFLLKGYDPENAARLYQQVLTRFSKTGFFHRLGWRLQKP